MNEPPLTPRSFHFGMRNSLPLVSEIFSSGIIDGARLGKARETEIEDNGCAATGFTNEAIGRDTAEELCSKVFATVRDPNNDLAGTSEIEKGTTTAAMAFTTMEGLCWRSAGDSLVVALGDNGRAIVLNELQHVLKKKNGKEDKEDLVIYNYLGLGRGNSKQDDQWFCSWQKLEQKLGTNNIRILLMSDGISTSQHVAQLEQHISELSRGLDFDAPDFAAQLMYRAGDYAHTKEDDRVVMSTKKPTRPEEQAMLGVFDGVGKGKEPSAIVANFAAKTAVEVVQERFQGEYETIPKPPITLEEMAEKIQRWPGTADELKNIYARYTPEALQTFLLHGYRSRILSPLEMAAQKNLMAVVDMVTALPPEMRKGFLKAAHEQLGFRLTRWSGSWKLPETLDTDERRLADYILATLQSLKNPASSLEGGTVDQQSTINYPLPSRLPE